MFRVVKKWLAKEAFYKMKFEEGLKQLDKILKNIECNQVEIQRLKKQTKEARERLKLAMNKLGNQKL